MGKWIVLSLDESEQQVYDKMMKIVDCAGISIEEKLDEDHDGIHNGEYLRGDRSRYHTEGCGKGRHGRNPGVLPCIEEVAAEAFRL